MFITDCFEELREASSPLIWSRGVQLSRNADFFEESLSPEEVVYRLKEPGQQISFRVTLLPKELDWECDCRGAEDPCHHVVGLSIFIKNDGLGRKKKQNDSASVVYQFKERDGKLALKRFIKRDGEEVLLTRPLVDLLGGIESGRIDHPPLVVTQIDYSLDEILTPKGDIKNITKLMPLLEQLPTLLLNGAQATVDIKGIEPRVHVIDEKRGFRIKIRPHEEDRQIFLNKLVITKDNQITYLKGSKLTTKENALVDGKGTYFEFKDASTVVSEFIPLLRQKIPVDIETKKLPRPTAEKPYIILETTIIESGRKLEILPRLLYGKPPLAAVSAGELALLQSEIVPERDRARETELCRKLQQELFLRPGQRVQLEKEVAFKRVEAMKRWEISGDDIDSFLPHKNLEFKINEINGEEWSPLFESKTLQSNAFPSNGEAKTANLSSVLSAWEKGEDYVRLIEGGWAELPVGWLSKYGSRLQKFLALKNSGKKQTSSIELSCICEDIGFPRPPSLEKLKESFDERGRITRHVVPEFLKANLRDYQKEGYNWLRFLKDGEMGALLADDMGLGKTVQTLSVLDGRCLVVAPTTVIYVWQEEIEKFRPDLKVNFYYGKNRKIPGGTGVTITSYAILRMEIEQFKSINWDVAVLDEAQAIKNPGSQVAKAAYKIESQFKIALSGTPIENRLEDLWSQFNFINPGLLGSRSEFLEETVRPINRGDKRTQHELRRRVRPFILRRLKNEVARELPPKTEGILYCDLNEEERDVYDALLGTTQKEVIEKLKEGGSVFGLLEILLRLRQSCCHRGMLPGEKKASSSKIEALLEHLSIAKESGHRALVFSQWTSFLDLLEPSLDTAHFKYLRIDGSTKNRKEIIDQFQNRGEADLMLISLKAGGVGMTLTAADHVYLMDPWWNPAVEEQAADRIHRIGQKNPVFVHRVVAKDTIEERILILQKKKRNLANAILSGAGEASSLTKEDIIELLE